MDLSLAVAVDARVHVSRHRIVKNGGELLDAARRAALGDLVGEVLGVDGGGARERRRAS